MTQVLIKNIDSKISIGELNLADKLNIQDRKNLIELIEYLEDYLYVSQRQKNENKIEYFGENEFTDLVSKYKQCK